MDAPLSSGGGERFGAEDLEALKQAFLATEEMRWALAEDQLEEVPGLGKGLAGALDEVQLSGLSSGVAPLIEAARQSARVLGEADSLPEARSSFADLSEALFGLARVDSRLQEGWHVFMCPMAEGSQKWFQAHEHLENPYMGVGMQSCGSGDDWGEEAASLEEAHDPDDVAHWTCSMHPSVRQADPGSCPICNMALTPVTHAELATGDVLVDSVRRQRIGVRTQHATRRALVRPIRAVGEVRWDESRVVDVTARVDGWVEALGVTRTGDTVGKGADLLGFYSPDLLATQRELLAAPEGSRLAATARERLLLAGMSQAETAEVERGGSPHRQVTMKSPMSGVVVAREVNLGAHVRAGALLYRIADPSQVWVVADVFEQDLPHVAVGQEVRVEIPHSSEREREGRISYVYPTLDPNRRTGRVRIELDNPEGFLSPGMLANVTFSVPLGEHLAIPAEALIFTGGRRLVFVDKSEGRLRPVEVQVGPQGGDWVAVEEGLEEHDLVVTSGAFLLAAESRIRSATQFWEATDAAE